jgi:hypothetical protein
MRFWSSPPVRERNSIAAFLNDLDGSTHCPLHWVIVRRQDHVPIGTCMLIQVNLSHRRAEVAFALAHAYWNKGYMHFAREVDRRWRISGRTLVWSIIPRVETMTSASPSMHAHIADTFTVPTQRAREHSGSSEFPPHGSRA